MQDEYHIPVMAEEIVQFLVKGENGEKHGMFLDVTLGGGGHAEALLNSSAPHGHVTGMDRDAQALEHASRRLAKFGERFRAVQSTFVNSVESARQLGVACVHGIVADLGVSSRQLDDAERGFSFRNDGPLDMRMDQSAEISAADIVNSSSEDQLADWIFAYGEERFSRRIAHAIVARRKSEKFFTTADLAEVVKHAMPAPARYGKIHPATRTFQALRIVVNGELDELEELLNSAVDYLCVNGRIAVISYHSLEDRIVKHKFRQLDRAKTHKVITKRPLQASQTEIRANPRARSAKMRVLERLEIVGGRV